MVLNINLQKHQNCFADGAHEAEKCDIDAIKNAIIGLLAKELDGSGTLESLTFNNRFTRELPADPETTNQRRQVMGACYSFVHPAKVAAPQLVTYSRETAALLDLSIETCESDDFLQVFVGNHLLAGMEPYATCYGGHQFGNWAGQLGDGRAINLGEIINQRSEAMFHLGVPTTRALSLALTGEQVVRDMFYDGHPKLEPGAVVCRVAPSFTRFGSFQIFASRGETEADYTIRTDFPHLDAPSPEVYLEWFKEVCRTTADMIVHWMRVGFVHGVMNTDNMSILGLTIDYGPYGWLEDYDPTWTPNTTDASGRRYCFGNQPQIAHWNLVQLANAIYPLIEQVEPLQQALDVYTQSFQQGWQTMMAQKLGLNTFEPDTDDALFTELFAILPLVETDMTIFFRRLAMLDVNVESLNDISDETLMTPDTRVSNAPGLLAAQLYETRMQGQYIS